MKHLALTVTIFLFCHGVDSAYKAAVLDYYATVKDTPENTIKTNLEEYRSRADIAKTQSVNIIVFPEYGLTTRNVNPEEYAIEINENNTYIKELSNMALARQLYIVVNLLEKSQESNDTKYYNTNLVFDKTGTILLKYRKINLIDEPKITPGEASQPTTFKTDFGVNFGIFTSSDILFRHPARTILGNKEIANVVFPSAWVSKMPFHASLSVEYGYAVENGVNLLASSYNNPKNGSGGSGIFLSDGKIAESYIADSPSTKIIVQEITTGRDSRNVCPSAFKPFGLPTDVSKSNVSDFLTEKFFNASLYNFTTIDLSQKNIEKEVCHRNFCCTFQLNTAEQNSLEIYKIMAYDGYLNYGQSQVHVRICSLLACEDNSNESCGARINGTTKFTKIKLEGNLPTDFTAIYTPITLNSYLLPLPQTQFCNINNGTDSSFVKLTTVETQQNVLVFGLFGRTETAVPFDDPTVPVNPNENSSAVSFIIHKSCTYFVLFTLVYFAI